MLERNRRTILTIAGVATLTFATVGIFSSLTWHSAALENEATNRSNIHRQNAHNRIEWVCPTAISQIDCIAETNQAARENEREEQDLAAQKITAWWTKVMGIAALIGMALSAVGVWLIKTTFDETRRGNEIAAAAAGSEYGASFDIIGGHVRIEAGMIFVRFRVKNTGKSPAHRVAIAGKYTAFEDAISTKGSTVSDVTNENTASFFSASSIMPDTEFSSLNNVWSGTMLGGKSKAETVEGFFRNGKNPVIAFDLVLSWATAFSANNKIGVKFSALEMKFRGEGGNKHGEHVIRDFSYYLVK